MLESQPRAAMHYSNLADALRQCGILCETRGDDSETVLALVQQSSADFEVNLYFPEVLFTCSSTEICYRSSYHNLSDEMCFGRIGYWIRC